MSFFQSCIYSDLARLLPVIIFDYLKIMCNEIMYLIGQYPIKNVFSVKDNFLNKKVLRQKQNKLATAPNQLLQNITPLQKKRNETANL